MITRRHLLALSLGLLGATLTASAPAVARSKAPFEGVVNLNTATEQELEMLPGIGPAKVRAIVEYRRARPFRTVDELVRIKGIGRKMLRKLRPHLTVNGPTLLRPAADAPPIREER